MEMSLLTKGALSEIVRGGRVEQPIVKIMEIAELSFSKGEPNRYRLCIFDGVTSYNIVMLSTRYNPQVLNKEIEKYSLIKIHEYKTTLMHTISGQRRLIIYLLQIEVVPNYPPQTDNNKITNNSQPIVITLKDQPPEINQYKSHINECKNKIHHFKILYDAEKSKTIMHQKQQQQIDAEIQSLMRSFELEKMNENNLINEINVQRAEKLILEEKLIDAEEVAGLRMPRHSDIFEEEEEGENNITDETDHLPLVKRLKTETHEMLNNNNNNNRDIR